jgi:WD40-like Beta Propeller Repeat
MVRIIFDWPFANRFIVIHIISGEMPILLFNLRLRQLNSHLASVLSWQAGEISAVITLNCWFPNISRHGGRLTFMQGFPEDANIYRIEISDKLTSKNPPTKLVALTRNDSGPQFSPDGNRIVFHSDRSGPLEVWTCDNDGANLAQVTFMNNRAGSPRWSLDGKQVAFDFYEASKGDVYYINSGAKDGAVIEFFDFATHLKRRLANLGIVDILHSPISVSHDRRQILYTQNDRRNADIMLVENFR